MAKRVVDTMAARPGEASAEQPVAQGAWAVAETNPLMTDGPSKCKHTAESMSTMHKGKNVYFVMLKAEVPQIFFF